MPTYLVEFFLPRSSARHAEDITARLEGAVRAIQSDGTPVRLVQALSIGDEELFQCVLDAPSVTTAEQLCRRAGLPAAGRPEQVDVLTLPHRRD